MRQYRFVTRWTVEAPIEAVFEALVRSEEWPRWWRGVTRVQPLADGGADGIGSVRRYTFKSLLPYALTFDMRTTRVEPPHHLEGEASGELVGTGRWTLAERGVVTVVTYEWDVGTARWWMNLLSPIAEPLFDWNHDVIMRWGEEGLRARLGLPPLPRRGRSRWPLLAAGALVGLLAAVGLRRGR